MVLAAREDVSRRWMERGRREGGRRGHCKDQKPPPTSDTNLTAASINVSEKRWEIGRNADSSIDKSDFIKDGNSTLKDTV